MMGERFGNCGDATCTAGSGSNHEYVVMLNAFAPEATTDVSGTLHYEWFGIGGRRPALRLRGIVSALRSGYFLARCFAGRPFFASVCAGLTFAYRELRWPHPNVACPEDDDL